jgi:hypothetical protein
MWRVSRSIVAALSAGGLLALVAVQAAPAQPQSDTATPKQPDDGRPGVLLLRNQNVLEGIVLRVGDRYRVQVPGGVIQVRTSEVGLIARDLDDLYRALSVRVPAGNAQGHLQLAQWCIRNQLLGYAAREMIAAQQIDADCPGLKRLEHQLAETARGPVATEPGSGRRAARPALDATRHRQPTRRSYRQPAGKRGKKAQLARPGRTPQRRSNRAQQSHHAAASRPAPAPERPAIQPDPPPTATEPAYPQPVDPFDPEIFNRRYATARAAAGSE